MLRVQQCTGSAAGAAGSHADSFRDRRTMGRAEQRL